MGTHVDVVTARALSTTEFVVLSGDKSGNGVNYTMNANAKSLLAVAPYVANTQTLAQTCMVELEVQSNDAPSISPYSIFAVPIPGGVGATNPGFGDSYMESLQPINVEVNGNDSIRFRARALLTNTVEPLVGALVYWSTEKPKDKQVHAQVTANTAVPTTATPTSGPTISVTGSVQQRLKAITAIFSTLVSLEIDRRIGFFTIDATGLAQDEFLPAEPIQGYIGAVGLSQVHLTKVRGLDNLMTTPATINSTFTQEEAALAASFSTGILYEEA